jgi:type IV secretory pathway VirB2 component (pilin)
MLKNNAPCAMLAGYVVLTIVLVAVTGDVFASDAGTGTGGSGLPWERVLQTLLVSVIGPVAYAFIAIGIVGSFAAMAMGGQIQEYTRQLMFLALLGGVMLFVRQVINMLFSGALI